MKIEVKKANDHTHQIKREDGELFYIESKTKKNKKLISFLKGEVINK